MLDFTILGNTGTYPMPERHLQQAYIQYQGTQILIDCGEGTLVQMMKAKVQQVAIDHILFTHMHGDHTFGIMGLVQTMSLLERTKPLNIYGDIMTLKLVQQLIKLQTCKFKVNFIEIKPDKLSDVLKIQDLKIQAIKLNHNTPVFGYLFNLSRLAKFDREKAIKNNIAIKYWNRLQHGETVTDDSGKLLTPQMVLGDQREGLKAVYMVDTRPCVNMMHESLKNPDLLIIEQMYFDVQDLDKAHKNKHMMLDEAIKIQELISQKKTLLTHLATSVQKNQMAYELRKRTNRNNISIGNCGEKIQLEFTD